MAIPDGTAATGHCPRAARLALTAAMAFVSVNIWTGGPLLALWLGSQVQGGGPPTMLAVFVVTVALAAICFALVKLLGFLGRLHDRLTGQVATVRAHAPWLRSMRGERPLYPGETPRLTALERVLVVTVALAALAFNVWFFFLSSSPFDSRSGRSDRAPLDEAQVASARPGSAIGLTPAR